MILVLINVIVNQVKSRPGRALLRIRIGIHHCRHYCRYIYWPIVNDIDEAPQLTVGAGVTRFPPVAGGLI